MLRKTAFALIVLTTLCAYGDTRTRSVGRAPSDAALAPFSVPGTTVSGTVTGVSGSIVSLAGGLVTIDASRAKITDDHGGMGSIASITPGTIVFAVLTSASVSPNAPLPASIIAVARMSQVTLSGPVQAIGSNTFSVLGRTITVDSNTSFGGGRIHGLADILPNDLVQVQANASGGVLVASSVLVFPLLPKAPTVIHGTVKSIDAASWVITDSAKKDWTIVVNAQTKIIGDPKVGDTVEILVNVDNSNQYVAVSIMKSIGVAQPLVVFTGHVKSMSATSWEIAVSSGHPITVAVNAQTKIIGDPMVNDGVTVTASVDAGGNYTAVAIIKLGIVPPPMTLRGKVKSIVPAACPITTCVDAVWTIGPEVGLGPDFLVHVNAQTKISGDPKVGDRVEVVAQTTSTGFVAISIVKQ